MLALAFFASVFSTFLWLIYMFMYLKDKLGGMSFGSLGLSDISLYIALLVLPVLVLWMIFGYVTQYLNFHRLNDNMYSLFKQMKKNLEYTDLIARIMLEAEQNGKDGFILNKFDLFITDMNELLAEIIQRGALAAPEQIDSLWAKTRNGAKWASVWFSRPKMTKFWQGRFWNFAPDIKICSAFWKNMTKSAFF